MLPDVWLRWSVDDLIAAMPLTGEHAAATIEFGTDGAVALGAEFRQIEQAWLAGIAAMARTGTGILLDDVFLGGGQSQ